MCPAEATSHSDAVGVTEGNGDTTVSEGVTIGATTVDTAKKKARSKATARASTTGETLGANLTVRLMGTVGVGPNVACVFILIKARVCAVQGCVSASRCGSWAARHN